MPQPLSTERTREVLLLHQAGHSPTEIARGLDLQRSQVYAAIKGNTRAAKRLLESQLGLQATPKEVRELAERIESKREWQQSAGRSTDGTAAPGEAERKEKWARLREQADETIRAKRRRP